MAEFADRPELTRVLPLVTGLVGIDPIKGGSVNLIPYVFGYMDYPNAVAAETASDVEIMVWESTASRSYYESVAAAIPVVQSAYVETVNPQRVIVEFDNAVTMDNADSFALTGTFGGTIDRVEVNPSPNVIDIYLSQALATANALNVVHTLAGGSDLRHKLVPIYKVADFTQAVTNNVDIGSVAITTASGDTVTPAVVTFDGDFSVGVSMIGQSTTDVDGVYQYSMAATVSNMTALDMCIAFVDAANLETATSGVDWTTNGATAEARAVGTNATVDLALFFLA